MIAASAAPPNALHIWTDGARIYVELPGSPGHSPYVISYYYSEGGLSKALALLGKHRVDYDYQGDLPVDYQHKPGKGTATQKATIEAMLLRLGVIK